MHIPDGFLTAPVWAPSALVAGAGVLACSRAASRSLPLERVPLMGVLGAFVFAAQMVNFPIAFGTSGHLLGTVLLTSLLGPTPAALVMACVLGVQALLFQDGGITALGANVLNLAVVPAFVGAALLRLGWHRAGAQRWLAVFAAAWLTTLLAAALASVELALSGVADLPALLLPMLGLHALIGLGEGLLTVAVLRVLLRARPDLAPNFRAAEPRPEEALS